MGEVRAVVMEIGVQGERVVEVGVGGRWVGVVGWCDEFGGDRERWHHGVEDGP